MTLRRFFGFLLLFVIATAIIVVALTQSATLLAGWSVWNTTGFAAGIAFFLLFLYILADQVVLRDPLRLLQNPMQVALEFNRRTLGLSDEAALANALGAMLEEWLNVRRSGWLLLRPRDTALQVRPVPGKGNLPETPIELPRANWLIQTLSERRGLVQQPELEAAEMAGMEREWLAQLGVQAYAPIFEAGLLTAILAIGPKDSGGRFSTAEVELLMLISALATPALKSARALSEVRQLNDDLAHLTEKLAEKAVHSPSDTSRSEFLAIASHELRTPITQLLGYADLLGTMVRENTLDRVTAAQVTESIVRACGRLNEVINQILDMAQIDADALEIRPAPTTVDRILRQALEPYFGAVRERRLTLNVTGLKDLPMLMADEQRLVQAFSQMTSNAIKYTPDGGRVDVMVRILPQEAKQPPRLLVTFADSGIGIDAKHQRLIFEKFFRVGSSALHSTSNTKFMGAGPGLGLPIAKGIVERHGGKIWVESPGHDPDKFPGSRFHVMLPLQAVVSDPQRDLPSQEQEAIKSRRSGLLG